MKRAIATEEWLLAELRECFAGSGGGGETEKLARALVDRLQMRYGGAYVYIPSAMRRRKEEVRAVLQSQSESGSTETIRRIASKYGLSIRQIYRICRGES